MNLDNFLAILFEPDDLICFSDFPHGTRAYPKPAGRDLFFSINPITVTDNTPVKTWHSHDVPRRADCNVARHSSFLLELDSMALDEQIKYVRDLVPITACTYSGSKSHHFVLTLKEPLKDAIEYALLARRLHKLVNRADPTTKNPSRLSRLPFRVRPETGFEQKLVYLGERIDFAQLDALLPQLPAPKVRTPEETRIMVTPQLLRAAHEPDAVMSEFNLGGRNQLFYWLGKRCDDLGLSTEARQFFVSTAYSNLGSQQGFTYQEAEMAARCK